MDIEFKVNGVKEKVLTFEKYNGANQTEPNDNLKNQSNSEISNIDVSMPKLKGVDSAEKFPEYLLPIIENIAKLEEISSYSIYIGNPKRHYAETIAVIYSVRIDGTKLGAQNKHESFTLSLIVKVTSNNRVRRTQLGAMNLFKREILMYNEILPLFKKFQETNLNKSDMNFTGYPKCYHTSYDDQNECAAIILEDLYAQGYRKTSVLSSPDFQHAQRLFIELGRFHGTSLVIKSKYPQLLEQFKHFNSILKHDEAFELMRNMLEANFERAVGSLLPHEEFKKEKLIMLKENFLDDIKELTSGESGEPFSVISHGDCWIGNIMYCYEVIYTLFLFIQKLYNFIFMVEWISCKCTSC